MWPSVCSLQHNTNTALALFLIFLRTLRHRQISPASLMTILTHFRFITRLIWVTYVHLLHQSLLCVIYAYSQWPVKNGTSWRDKSRQNLGMNRRNFLSTPNFRLLTPPQLELHSRPLTDYTARKSSSSLCKGPPQHHGGMLCLEESPTPRLQSYNHSTPPWCHGGDPSRASRRLARRIDALHSLNVVLLKAILGARQPNTWNARRGAWLRNFICTNGDDWYLAVASRMMSCARHVRSPEGITVFLCSVHGMHQYIPSLMQNDKFQI